MAQTNPHITKIVDVFFIVVLSNLIVIALSYLYKSAVTNISNILPKSKCLRFGDNYVTHVDLLIILF